MNELLLTPEGLSRLQDELERLVTVDRDAVRTRLRDGVETDGDLAGNGDYLDAKEEQALLEQRIALLKGRLGRARLIDTSGGPDDVVTLGSRVRLRALETDETVEYQIVDSIECDPSVFRISHESPVGKAVLGRTQGEKIAVEVPVGTLGFEILDVAA